MTQDANGFEHDTIYVMSETMVAIKNGKIVNVLNYDLERLDKVEFNNNTDFKVAHTIVNKTSVTMETTCLCRIRKV